MLLNKTNNVCIKINPLSVDKKSSLSFGLAKADKDLRQHMNDNIQKSFNSLSSVYSLINVCENLERSLLNFRKFTEPFDITMKTKITLLLNLRIVLSQLSNLLNPKKRGEYRKEVIKHYQNMDDKNEPFTKVIIQALINPSIDKTPIADMLSMCNPIELTNSDYSANADDILPQVAGYKPLKKIIYDVIIDPIKNYDIRYDTKPTGVLLYGPTGVGKSFIAKNIANELGWDFEEISLGKQGSDYMNKTSLNIQERFQEAKRKGKVVLLFDEFDSMAYDRGSIARGESHKLDEVNTLLQCLEGCAEKNVLVIATSNLKKNIDDAILRPGRFSLSLEVGFPDLESRIDIFRIELLKTPIGRDLANNPEELKTIATMFDSVSSASIVHSIIPSAKRLAKFTKENLMLKHFKQVRNSDSVKSVLNHDKNVLEKYAISCDNDFGYTGKYNNFGFIPKE